MKTRILSLLLAVSLLFGLLAVPAAAASRSDVYNYLRDYAKSGGYDDTDKCYYTGYYITSDNSAAYEVSFYPSDSRVELTIYIGAVKVAMVLNKSMNLPYTAYVEVRADKTSTGKVDVKSGYDGSAYTQFKSFSGDTSIKADMLEILNSLLPIIIEFTRGEIYDGGYTLKDMGLSSYNKCVAAHCVDYNGTVIQQPTCGQDGVRAYICTVCGKTVSTESIPATGKHTWGQGVVIIQPTCTEEGTMRYTCTVCKSATRDEWVPALGHAWALTEVLTEDDTLHACTGRYTCTRCEKTKEASLCAAEVFTDMPKQSHWAHDAIDWAYFKGLTGGTSYNTFSPNKVVTRGEVVTFLHTIEGKPEVEAENPFKDVKAKDFYYNAVLWAVANGITKGTTETTFSPKNTCTRAEIVMFLWAAAGRPEPENTENRFQDVKANSYFRTAVLWAVENGITGGIDATHFGPKVNCTRAQVMLFLKAAYPILTAEETPEQPEDPTDPTEPEDPTEPTEPEDPTEPTEPEDPTEPTEPEDPTEPTEPEDPTEPTAPVDPTEPIHAENPAKP